jgi:hypothetical protein
MRAIAASVEKPGSAGSLLDIVKLLAGEAAWGAILP